MALTHSQRVEWNFLTSMMILNLVLCFILGILQYLSNEYRDNITLSRSKFSKKKKSRFIT